MSKNSSLKYPQSSLRRARKLRSSTTEAEKRLWSHLRANKMGMHFRRQVPVGPYVVDFIASKTKLIIELDGSQHLQESQANYDSAREQWLRERGFAVLRFNNLEILGNPEGVLLAIRDFLFGKKL